MKPIILKEKEVKGHFSKVYNKDRHFAAAPIYFHLKAEGVHYLFTPSQMDVAMDRAEKNPEDLVDFEENPEDLPKPLTFWQKVKRFFGRSL